MPNQITLPIPPDINPLSPNGYRFAITKLAGLTYWCQQLEIPGLILGAPEYTTPFTTQPIPGETLTYNQLNVQFLIDENMTNYMQIYNWIVALGFPNDYSQYIAFLADDTTNYAELAKNFSDGIVQILGSNNEPIKEIQFVDMFPTSLESITFSSTNDGVTYLVGQASFRYGYYKFL